MSGISKPIRLVLIGWLSVLAMAISLVIVHGMDYLRSAAFFGVVGVVMGLWVWRRQSRASLIVSLVLGALHAFEQAAYSAAGATADEVDPVIVIMDLIFLAGAIVIVVGAVRALRDGRNARQLQTDG